MKYCLLFILSSLYINVIAQTTLYGTITDEQGMPLEGASIALYKNGVLTTGTATEADGYYEFEHLDPGTYTVEIYYLGYTNALIKNVKVSPGKQTELTSSLESDTYLISTVTVSAPKVPLVLSDGCRIRATIRNEQFIPSPIAPAPLAEINYYPNPTTDLVHLILPERLDFIQVFDAQDKLLKTYKNVDMPQLELSFASYPSGTYFIRCVKGDKHSTLPLIVE